MLTHNSNECTVHTRLEAYSCKAITKDKRMHRHLEQNYHTEEQLALSPQGNTGNHEPEITVFGPMDSYTSRKTLYLLIGTLNHAFPDHDFSDLRPENFSREQSGASILNALSTTLLSQSSGNDVGGSPTARTYSAYPSTSPDFFPSSLPTSSSPVHRVITPLTPPQIVTGTHPTLYRILDDVIKLDECELYTYTPDALSDPHSMDSDDEDEGWDSEDASSEGPDEGVFDFFDDEVMTPTVPSRRKINRPLRLRTESPVPLFPDDEDTSPESVSTSPTRFRPRSFMRKRSGGGLLWSTHAFFHNRKQKRILYITTWARKKSNESPMTRSQEMEGFKAWDGAVGAGARAFGLHSSQIRKTTSSSM